MSDTETKEKISLASILFTVFLDMLGIGIIIPIVAPVVLKSNVLTADTPFALKTILLGLLISSFPLAQFFSAPVLGAWSDKVGRKKALTISIAGSALGYLVFAIGVLLGNIWILFAGRILDGITGGNIAVIYSSIADLSDEVSKAKNFGLVGMTFGLGFIIGPFLGGELANPNLVSWFNYSTPFFFCFLLSLFNLVLVITRFKETIKEKRDTPINIFTGFKNIKKAFGIKEMRNIFFIAFLTTFGFTMFSQFFQVFLIEKFGYSQFNIGRLLGYFGIWSVITQGGIVRRLSKKMKPEKILSFSLLFMAISFISLIIPEKSSYLYLTMALVAIAQGITSPNVTATVSNLASSEIQGEILGINQSVQALAQAIPPIIGGLTVSMDLNLPVTLSAICMFFAWIFFIMTFRKSKTA